MIRGIFQNLRANTSGSTRRSRAPRSGISLASAGESYVLTTGTGSGKSLSYFIPIIDHCLKAKQVDKSPRTRAIVVYPMNALANSQLEELKKFLGADPGTRPVTFGRFTGQESTEEQEAMKANPPDILLTNFMMLELLLTRQPAAKALTQSKHRAPVYVGE